VVTRRQCRNSCLGSWCVGSIFNTLELSRLRCATLGLNVLTAVQYSGRSPGTSTRLLAVCKLHCLNAGSAPVVPQSYCQRSTVISCMPGTTSYLFTSDALTAVLAPAQKVAAASSETCSALALAKLPRPWHIPPVPYPSTEARSWSLLGNSAVYSP
jgi:hypothetical protein